MDIKLFEALGKIAGLAGLSIGLVFLVVKTVLQKAPAGKLNSAQTYKIINGILFLTGVVAVIGLGAWAYSNRKINSHTITGHVMEADNKKPVSGAEVIIGGRTEATQTDDSGNFTLSFLDENIPSGHVHVFVSKEGYDERDKDADLGQYVELSMLPSRPKPAVASAPAAPPTLVVDDKPETYVSPVNASGRCDAYGEWSPAVCTPKKPDGWKIQYQQFQIAGDPTRSCGGGWTHCEPAVPITDTMACYHFQTQGHSEECGHSGNTGIHYSQGTLTVLWKHPPAS